MESLQSLFLWQVIPAAGQFFTNTRWMPHPNYSNPKLRETYDPKEVNKA